MPSGHSSLDHLCKLKWHESFIISGLPPCNFILVLLILRGHSPLSIGLPIAHLGGSLDLCHRLRHLLVERLGQHEREEAGGDGENAEDHHWVGRVGGALSG